MCGMVSAQTLIVPTVSATETYDSNVFFTPKSLLEPGTDPEDFITTVTPQILVSHTGSLIRGNFSAGALVTKYINNPVLDYTGVNVTGQLDVKDWVSKISQRISALSVRGAYQFAPTLGGFGGVAGGVGPGFGVTTITSPINTGIITNRVSMHNINLGITGGYILTRSTTVTGTYNYTKLTFGGQSGGVDNQLFDTDGHQATMTLTTQLSPTDSAGTSATMSHYQQSQSGGSGSGSFTTISGTANWARRWTERLSTSLSGGAIATLPIDTGIPGQSIKTQLAPTVTASVNYTSFSEGLRAVGASRGPFDDLPTLAGSLNPGGIVAPGQFTTSLSYGFSVFPSYAFGAGPMKTHIVGANLSGGITSKLTGQLGANFSHGTTDFPQSTFDTVGITAGVRYLLGPVLASLTYNWLYFTNDSSPTPQTQSEYAFSKKMVMLSLSYAFTNQSFFRMGAFGNWGAPSSGEGGASPSDAGTGGGPSGGGSGSLKKE